MKIYNFFIFFSLVLVLISCSPQTKESYLEDYEEFISTIDKESENYTDEDWINIEEKYNKFNGEWYDKFEDELTWKEQIVIYKYQSQFYFFKLTN